MENIFKDAYFGKPYKTRDGKKAIYLFPVGCGVYCITEEFKNKIRYYHFNGIPYDFEFSKYRGEDIISEWNEIDVYISDGRVDSRFFDSKNDIVSEWDEKVDEDKLQALQAKCLAEDIENGVMKRDMSHYYPHDEQSWIQGYAVGFEKAYRLTKKKT